MKLNKYLIDFVTITIILIFSFFALYFNIPGYGEICDQDSGMIFISLLILIPACLVFLVRNIVKISKNNSNKFRKVSLVIFFSLLILSLGGFKKLIFITYYGKIEHKAYSTKNNMVFIKLFKNGKFYSEGFYTSCYEEITGTYKIKNMFLELEYEKESDFFSKLYKIKGKELINFNQKKDTLLIE